MSNGASRHIPRASSLSSALHAVVRHPRGTRAEVEAFQDRALARLVAHVQARVPFYRMRWASAGVDPASVRRLGDLARLPVISKDELRAAPSADVIAQGL